MRTTKPPHGIGQRRQNRCGYSALSAACGGSAAADPASSRLRRDLRPLGNDDEPAWSLGTTVCGAFAHPWSPALAKLAVAGGTQATGGTD